MATTKPDRYTQLHDHLSLIPWAAGLIAAGYYQADLAEKELDWQKPWAFAFPLAIEVGIAWAAGNLNRRLVNRDSAIMARLGFYGLITLSCGLLFWHAKTDTDKLAPAIAISGISLIAAWIWTQRTSLQRRDLMRSAGLIYPPMPNFPIYRWALCPIETACTIRYAVRHAISDPIEALDTYRTDRQTRQAKKQKPRPPDQTEQSDRQTDDKPDRTKQTRPPTIPHQTTRPDRAARPRQKPRPPDHQTVNADQTGIDELVYMSAIREHPDWPQTTLTQISDIVAAIDPTGTCGKSRAIRLRNKAQQKEVGRT